MWRVWRRCSWLRGQLGFMQAKNKFTPSIAPPPLKHCVFCVFNCAGGFTGRVYDFCTQVCSVSVGVGVLCVSVGVGVGVGVGVSVSISVSVSVNVPRAAPASLFAS